MKLRQAILENEGFLYIGAESGFLFIGNKEDAIKSLEMESRTVQKDLERRYLEYIKIQERTPGAIKRHKAEIHKLENEIGYVDYSLKNMSKDYSKEETTKERTALLKQKHELERTLDNEKHRLGWNEMMVKKVGMYIDSAKSRLDGYVPLLDRCVVDIYPREIVEPLGTIIKIEGDENGQYWLYEEVDKGWKAKAN